MLTNAQRQAIDAALDDDGLSGMYPANLYAIVERLIREARS